MDKRRITNRDLLKKISIDTLVLTQNGSWKWQQAYRVSLCVATERIFDSFVIFKTVSYTRKYSLPQLTKKYDIHYDVKGSRNHTLVPRNYAVKCMGERYVKRMERDGFKFVHDLFDK